MSLKEILLSDLKGAMKAKDAIRLNTIRRLKSEIKNQEIKLKQELDDDAIITIVSSLIKKGKEAIDLFDKGNRPDLSKKEQEEVAILKKYLPEQVSEADLRIRIQEVIKELGVQNQGDLGRVMKILVPEFRGRADNKLVKNLVGEYLGN
ncbi:MAG: GatB/YqeY domain-containing protein [Nitrospinae bacterium]|nr:GatB/YqeY domain-containing protein [Nitrospinota bacterium]